MHALIKGATQVNNAVACMHAQRKGPIQRPCCWTKMATLGPPEYLSAQWLWQQSECQCALQMRECQWLAYR